MQSNESRPFTPTVEDYLKIIYRLQEEDEAVSTDSIARASGKSAAAASRMMKQLAEVKLIHHTPYYGVRLTDAGEKVALEIIRHHRLLELYLHQALGYSWDRVDAEAEHLEHHISEEFEDRIDRMLDFPVMDPHGDPIPSRDGVMPARRGESLATISSGSAVNVCRVSDRDPEALRYLDRMGLRLGLRMMVLDVQPFNGPLTIEFEGGSHSIGRELAGFIFVELDEPAKIG